jgi:hypothetical protein
VEWLLPPIRDVIFVVLFLSLSFGAMSQRLLRDGGTGWHIRTGERILALHQIPRTDPFSLSTGGKAWYAWEWFYEASLGTIYGWAGLNGAVAATALLVAFTFAWLFGIMRSQGTDAIAAVVLLLLAFGAAAIHLYVRPHVVSWLLALLFWFVLERARQADKPGLLIVLPLLIVLWVNVHGGFLLGLVLIGIYEIDAAWRLVSDRKGGLWFFALSATLIASALATLLNPYGVALHRHIYQYVSDPFLMHHIQEFQAPNFRTFSPLCFAALLLICLCGVAMAGVRPSLREGLVLIFGAWSGLYASRNLPVAAILICAVAACFVTRAWRRNRQEGEAARSPIILDRIDERDASLRSGLWPVIAIALVLWMVTHDGRLGHAHVIHAQFDGSRFPVAAVDYIERQGIAKPMFSIDQWGGYLIYRNYPAVLVDDRHDLYGDEFFKAYLRIIHVEPGWQDALDQTKAAVALLPSDSPLAKAMATANQWKEVYRDNVATLFECK